MTYVPAQTENCCTTSIGRVACPYARGRYACHSYCGCARQRDPETWWWDRFIESWAWIGHRVGAGHWSTAR